MKKTVKILSALLVLLMIVPVVVSCGKDNEYRHPHTEALDNFASIGATVYRTDELGTIIFITDGVELSKR